jgi:Tol biopolymer transport system component
LDASRQSNHRFPQFLPDGRHFLFFALGTPEARGVYLGGLDGSEPRRLFDADSPAFYASTGHLLFVRQGTLLAQPFDPVRLALGGSPYRVADQVATSRSTSSAVGLSTSAAGPIVYRPASTGGHSQFAWFDRSGRKLGAVGDADAEGSVPWSLSPDGRRVAMQRNVNGKADIWLVDTTRGALTRFTSDTWQNNWPVWSPDGKRLAYGSNAKGTYDLYSKSSTGAGGGDPVLVTPEGKYAIDWSADGRFLLYRTSTSRTGNDVWALPLNGEKRPFPVVQTDFDEGNGQFSPDSKWIAYQSNETGRFEIYAQPFPGPGSKLRISTTGGAQAHWGRDSKELFYIALDGRLMAVPIRVSDAQSLDVGVAVPLFATHVGGAIQSSTQQYAVSPDGRFLMNTVSEEAAAPITVILNWKPKP